MLTNSRDIIRRLENEGWRLVRSKGSHHQFKHPAKPGRVTVPHPKKDMPLKTVLSIYKTARLGEGLKPIRPPADDAPRALPPR